MPLVERQQHGWFSQPASQPANPLLLLPAPSLTSTSAASLPYPSLSFPCRPEQHGGRAAGRAGRDGSRLPARQDRLLGPGALLPDRRLPAVWPGHLLHLCQQPAPELGLKNARLAAAAPAWQRLLRAILPVWLTWCRSAEQRAASWPPAPSTQGVGRRAGMPGAPFFSSPFRSFCPAGR